MNAPSKLAHFASPFGEPVTGDLLCSDFQMTDTLQICLYGELPGFKTGHLVTSICVNTDANRTDIVALFRREQLDAMGEWLDHKDKMGELPQRIAANAKYEAVRIKF